MADLAQQRSWWKFALVSIIAIELLGGLSGWLSNSGYGNGWFDGLNKPFFMPPGWAFGVVWPILYLLMGIALAMAIALPASPRRRTRPDPVLRPAGAQLRLVADLLRRARHRARQICDLRHDDHCGCRGGPVLPAAQARGASPDPVPRVADLRRDAQRDDRGAEPRRRRVADRLITAIVGDSLRRRVAEPAASAYLRAQREKLQCSPRTGCSTTSSRW